MVESPSQDGINRHHRDTSAHGSVIFATPADGELRYASRRMINGSISTATTACALQRPCARPPCAPPGPWCGPPDARDHDPGDLAAHQEAGKSFLEGDHEVVCEVTAQRPRHQRLQHRRWTGDPERIQQGAGRELPHGERQNHEQHPVKPNAARRSQWRDLLCFRERLRRHGCDLVRVGSSAAQSRR